MGMVFFGPRGGNELFFVDFRLLQERLAQFSSSAGPDHPTSRLAPGTCGADVLEWFLPI